MPGKIHTYSPEDVSFAVGGAIISGFSEGTFITAERDEDAFTKVVGADGDVTRSKNANKSGTVACTLKASSASNDVLSAIAAADEINGEGVVPIIIKDNSGRSVCSGKGWIKKTPAQEYGKEVGDREWALDVAVFTNFVGGNTES